MLFILHTSIILVLYGNESARWHLLPYRIPIGIFSTVFPQHIQFIPLSIYWIRSDHSTFNTISHFQRSYGWICQINALTLWLIIYYLLSFYSLLLIYIVIIVRSSFQFYINNRLTRQRNTNISTIRESFPFFILVCTSSSFSFIHSKYYKSHLWLIFMF